MFKKLLILPAAFLAFACGGNDKKVDEPALMAVKQ